MKPAPVSILAISWRARMSLFALLGLLCCQRNTAVEPVVPLSNEDEQHTSAEVQKRTAKPTAPEQVPQEHVLEQRAPTLDRDLEEHIFYFVMLDRFADGDSTNNFDVAKGDKGSYHGGDLVGLTRKLDYLADLGVTALWITPIVDQIDHPVQGAGFPDWAYHGYWGDDFTALDRHWGSEDDLHQLLEQAHKRGIAVVLDVVINHAGYRARWAGKPRWTRASETRSCPADDRANDVDRCLLGLPDFRTEDPKIRRAILDWQLNWAQRFAFDGFRVDTFKHVEEEMLIELHRRAEAIAREEHQRENFLILGEWWGTVQGGETSQRLVASGAADTLFDFSFHGLVEDFLAGRMRAEAAGHHLAKRCASGQVPLVHFLDSHDVPTFLHRLAPEHKPRYPLAAVLQFTTFGIPLITWGNELGRTGGDWPHNRAFMPWEHLAEPAGIKLHKTWRSLAHLRRRWPQLRGTEFTLLKANTDQTGALLAYQRGPTPTPESEGPMFVVALALGEAQTLDLSWPYTNLRATRVFGTDAVQENVEQGGKSLRLRATIPRDTAAIWMVHGKNNASATQH